MRRISVIRNEQIVPLLPGKPLNDSVFSPWSDLILEKHCVGAIEIPAHEHSSFLSADADKRPLPDGMVVRGKILERVPGPGIPPLVDTRNTR